MTTERAYAPGRPVVDGVHLGPMTAPHPATRPAVRRRDLAIPAAARAGMLLGASTALYGVTLAGVAALQSADDAALAAARAPLVADVEAARIANDRLEAIVLAAGGSATAVGDRYAATAAWIEDLEARLDALGALVAEVQGSAASLPARISLPSVTVRGTTAAPRTQATTGASGVP
jgi:hypothetical protein